MTYNRRSARIINPARRILTVIRSRCKAHSIPFDLELKDITIPDRCPVLDIPLMISGRKSPHLPSVDRINPYGGYTKDNIVIVSWRANRLKSNATVAELIQLARFYARITGVPL